MELTKPFINKTDAFQIRGLRKILETKHHYYARTSANAKVFENATFETYRKGSPEAIARNSTRMIQKFSDMYKRQKKKLLGHVFRAQDSDTMTQISFKAGIA